MKNSPATGLSNDDGDGNKNFNKAIGLGPVHTNTFSFENAYISKGLGLPGHTYTPSGSIVWKTFLNVDQDENTSVRIVGKWKVENGRKRIKMKTMTENIASACL